MYTAGVPNLWLMSHLDLFWIFGWFILIFANFTRFLTQIVAFTEPRDGFHVVYAWGGFSLLSKWKDLHLLNNYSWIISVSKICLWLSVLETYFSINCRWKGMIMVSQIIENRLSGVHHGVFRGLSLVQRYKYICKCWPSQVGMIWRVSALGVYKTITYI